jgi:hypothetical protein
MNIHIITLKQIPPHFTLYNSTCNVKGFEVSKAFLEKGFVGNVSSTYILSDDSFKFKPETATKLFFISHQFK